LANFKTHFNVAAACSGFVATSILAINLISPVEAIILFLFGTIGGLLPDLDSHNSVPLRIGFKIFSFLVSFIVMFSLSDSLSVVEMIIIWIITFIFMRVVVLELFNKFTVHRGIFHSIPASIVFGLIVTIILYNLFGYNEFNSWLGGFFITFGSIVHLVLDEAYSIDLMGRRVKKSFGTALKLYDEKTVYPNIVIYFMIFGLLLIAPDFSEFLKFISTYDTYEDIKDVLMPQGIWFDNLVN
jgi:membrane-bound metal-dependent hydrolase YbcI (DUF457 family)